MIATTAVEPAILTRPATDRTLLVRYGVVPEVARFLCTATGISRGAAVVVRTHRGDELGLVLEALRAPSEPGGEEPSPPQGEILRAATDLDREKARTLRTDAEGEFPVWQQRIADWKLDLQLIDLEWTIDRAKLILYVLNERGPESTKLALQAAAAGLGLIEVQPVSAEGLVPRETGGGGGCGSGGGSCGCHN